MRFDVITIFPQAFEGPLGVSIIKRAVDAGLVTINIVDLRDYTHDAHRSVDDAPYGGGGGMVMMPAPIFEAVEDLASRHERRPRVVLLSPQGRTFTQRVAEELAREDGLILICGHYEGVDERVRVGLADDEVSIGDYVLTGGELPAMVLIDAVVRLLPGVVGNAASIVEDSFTSGLLEHPHYTRPLEYRGLTVPAELVSGHHEEVRRWRRREALRRTLQRRPDLLEQASLTEEDRKLLASIREEAE
jgi:tRNA (guanine37-N1)-methyltransferase